MKEHGVVSCFSGKGFVFQVCLSGFVDLIAFDILFHLLLHMSVYRRLLLG